MPAVIRTPMRWAFQNLFMVPSDYVLKDRFGVEVSESTFMQNVEDATLTCRQWYWDTLGGYTFNAVPSLYFRSSKTTAQIFTDYTGEAYRNACMGILAEMEAAGLFDRRSRYRLPGMYIPLALEGYSNAIDSGSYGCPFFTPGAVVGARTLGGRTMGGLTPLFLSVPTTIAVGAAAGATTLQVAAGTGRNFAVAALFSEQGSRVVSFTGSATGSTSLTLNDATWAAGASVGSPIDAVLWPYGQDPSTSNAEAVQVTGVSGNTVTVVRARYGTSAVPVIGGGEGAGGMCIYRRQQYARIWTGAASPEAPGAEVVIITGINGDSLTVQRGKSDAMLRSATTPRAVLAGDNIAVTYPESMYFSGQTVAQAIGGLAHELGHNLGAYHFNAAQVKNWQYVTQTSGTYSVVTGDRSPTSVPVAGTQSGPDFRPSIDSVVAANGYSQDFWEHLPHTPDNVTTPGLFGQFVMYNWWDFPFGNVPGPAAGFTQNEMDRIRLSPFITAQARPAVGNIVTSHTFRAASGAIGPAGVAAVPPVVVAPVTSSVAGYVMTPVLMLATDTVFNLPLATVLANLDASYLAIQQYYWDKNDQRTFDLAPTITVNMPYTEAERNRQYAQLEYNAARSATAAVAAPGQVSGINVLHSWPGQPGDAQTWGLDPFWGNLNDTIGFTENSDAVARIPGGDYADARITVPPSPADSGSTFTVLANQGLRFSANNDVTFPVTARIWGSNGSYDSNYETVTVTAATANTVTVTRGTPRRTIVAGDLIGRATPTETIANKLDVLRGALAHEMGHQVGLQHPGVVAGDPDSGTNRLMSIDFQKFPNCVLTAWEKARLLEPARPQFLHYRPTRPGSVPTGPQVQPVVLWASDTANSETAFPTNGSYQFTHPFPAAAFLARVDENVRTVRQWYFDHLDGYTFDALPAVMYVFPQTEATLRADPTYGTAYLITKGMVAADSALPEIDLTRMDRMHHVITPLVNPSDTYPDYEGLTFAASNFSTLAAAGRTNQPYVTSQWNRVGSISKVGTFMGASAPAYVVSGEDPFATSRACDTMAHELGHAFGFDPTTNLTLPHASPADPTHLMNADITTLSSAYFLTPEEKALLKASPFLTVHATRP